jgi:hypothetical protein
MSVHPMFTDEHLTIDGFLIGSHNVWAESLAPLFQRIRRGVTEPVPYVAGGIPFRKRRTFHSSTLVINVIGELDADGATVADPREGLHEALAGFESSLLEDVDGTRTAVWTRPDGDRTAEVDIMSWTIVGNTPVTAVGQLELSVAAGWWEPDGS